MKRKVRNLKCKYMIAVLKTIETIKIVSIKNTDIFVSISV